jgi:hypothetical protein
VLENLAPEIRRRCLSALYRLCGREALIPKSLELPLCCNLKERPLCHGEFADVWRGSLNGKEVAAKVLRVGMSDDLSKVKKVSFFWRPRIVLLTTPDCLP